MTITRNHKQCLKCIARQIILQWQARIVTMTHWTDHCRTKTSINWKNIVKTLQWIYAHMRWLYSKIAFWEASYTHTLHHSRWQMACIWHPPVDHVAPATTDTKNLIKFRTFEGSQSHTPSPIMGNLTGKTEPTICSSVPNVTIVSSEGRKTRNLTIFQNSNCCKLCEL